MEWRQKENDQDDADGRSFIGKGRAGGKCRTSPHAMPVSAPGIRPLFRHLYGRRELSTTNPTCSWLGQKTDQKSMAAASKDRRL